jgi:TPR repeat protein
MEILCGACGDTNPVTAHFCNRCGASLLSAAAEAEKCVPSTQAPESDQDQSESMPYFPPEAFHSKDGETLAQEDVRAALGRLKRIPRWGWVSLGACAIFAVSALTLTVGPLSPVSRNIRNDKRSCDTGDAKACEKLGNEYFFGCPGRPAPWGCSGAEAVGVETNYPLALAFYTKGCDAGSGNSCTMQGTIYRDPKGVDKDWPRALALFNRACDLGDCSVTDELKREAEQAKAREARFKQRGCYNDAFLHHQNPATSATRNQIALDFANRTQSLNIFVSAAGEDNEYLLFAAPLENEQQLRELAAAIEGSDKSARANFCLQQFAEVQFVVRDANMNQRLISKFSTDPLELQRYVMQTAGATPSQ